MTDSPVTRNSDWLPQDFVTIIKDYWRAHISASSKSSEDWSRALPRNKAEYCFDVALRGLQKLNAAGVQTPTSIYLNKAASIVIGFPRHNVCLNNITIGCKNDRWSLTNRDLVKLDDIQMNDPECLKTLALFLSDEGPDFIYSKSKSCEKIVRIIDIVTHTRNKTQWSVSLGNGYIDNILKENRIVVRVFLSKNAGRAEKYDHVIFKSRAFSNFWSVKYLDHKLGVTSRGIYDTSSEEDMKALENALQIFPIVLG